MLPLETLRLLLRAITLDDAPALFAIAAHPEIAPMLGRAPDATVGALRERLSRGIELQRELGYGFWAVVDRASGRFLGTAGFAPGDGPDELELGFTLARDAWGQGLATEAARACVRAGFDPLGARRIVARSIPGNDRARRVLEKLGFRADGSTGGLVRFVLER